MEASKPAPREAATPAVQVKWGRSSPDTASRKTIRNTSTANDAGSEVPTQMPPPPTPGHSSMGLALPPRTHSTPPSPRTSNLETPTPSPATSRRIRSSIFPPNACNWWTIPEFSPDEDTLFLTASNGARMCNFTPPTRRTAAYRGATINDACRVLFLPASENSQTAFRLAPPTLPSRQTHCVGRRHRILPHLRIYRLLLTSYSHSPLYILPISRIPIISLTKYATPP